MIQLQLAPDFERIINEVVGIDENEKATIHDGAIRLGSIYGKGEWSWDGFKGQAKRTTCRFDRMEDKIIIEQTYTIENGDVKRISYEEI